MYCLSMGFVKFPHVIVRKEALRFFAVVSLGVDVCMKLDGTFSLRSVLSLGQ